MSKLTTGSFSIDDLESVQITINNIVGAAKEAAEEKAKELGPMVQLLCQAWLPTEAGTCFFLTATNLLLPPHV